MAPSGDVRVQELPVSSSDMLLPLLQKMVGGHIEVVPQFRTYSGEPCIVLCDEEGKLKGRPRNDTATEAWASSLGCRTWQLGDHLVGDIAILQGSHELLENF